MKDEVKNNVSIQHKRLKRLMDEGHGKKYERLKSMIYPSNDPVFNPEAVIQKIEGHDGTKWKQTELAAVTGIDRQTIGKLYNNTYNTKTGNNFSTIKRIAEALDVDTEYLTGEQRKMKRLSPDQEEQRRNKWRMIHEKARIDSIKKLIPSAWHLVLKYDEELVIEKNGAPIASSPVKYTAFDLYYEDDLICENRDIKDLEPFIQAMEHLLLLSEDIADRFLSDLQDPEE